MCFTYHLSFILTNNRVFQSWRVAGDEPLISQAEAAVIAAGIYAAEHPNLEGTPQLKGGLRGTPIQVTIPEECVQCVS